MPARIIFCDREICQSWQKRHPLPKHISPAYPSFMEKAIVFQTSAPDMTMFTNEAKNKDQWQLCLTEASTKGSGALVWGYRWISKLLLILSIFALLIA